MIRTSHRKELLYARSAVATTAHAYGLHAIDMVCIDYANMTVLEEECREGREMGFTGKAAGTIFSTKSRWNLSMFTAFGPGAAFGFMFPFSSSSYEAVNSPGAPSS